MDGRRGRTLLTTRQVSDKNFKAMTDLVGERGIVELVALMGQYTGLTMLFVIDRYPRARPTSKQAVVTVPPRLARPAETPKLLGPTRLAHDGFGFHTNFPGNFVGITLLEFRQEEFDG